MQSLRHRQWMMTVRTEELVSHAIERMREYKISQIPVEDLNGFVGSVGESDLLRAFFADKDIANKPIKELMKASFPIVAASTTLDQISKLFTKENEAVLVDLGDEKHHIITKYDLINVIA